MEGSEGGAADTGQAAVRVPYERETMEPRPLARLEEILELDRQLQEVTASYPKPIRLGSILRLSEASLANWGVEVNRNNRYDLAALANAQYLHDDTEDGPDSTERNALRAFRKELGRNTLGEITNYISRVAREFLHARDDGKRRFAICDLAAGSSGLCTAVAASLRADPESEAILPRVTFHIVDYTEKLLLAERNLQPFGAGIMPYSTTDEKFLHEHIMDRKDGFDLVLLSCHSHRKPFISDYLATVHKVVKPKGVFISGDWHSPLTSYPGLVYDLLVELGVDKARLAVFEDLLGPFMLDRGYDSLSGDHTQSLNHHVEYWHRMSTEIGKPKYGDRLKVRVLSAFLNSDEFLKHVKNAGFETDRDRIASAFPRAKLPSRLPIRLQDRSDSAAVTVGLRR